MIHIRKQPSTTRPLVDLIAHPITSTPTLQNSSSTPVSMCVRPTQYGCFDWSSHD
jgi:hypothetical protein